MKSAQTKKPPATTHSVPDARCADRRRIARSHANRRHPTSYDGQAFDLMLHAGLARLTGGLSPVSFNLALIDWLSHLSLSPAKQAEMANKTLQKIIEITAGLLSGASAEQIAPTAKTHPPDQRFKNPLWNDFPFNLYVDAFIAGEKWWNEMTCDVEGVSGHRTQIVNFAARQMLDIFSPSNFPWLNPEIVNKTFSSNGNNFIDGLNNFCEDAVRAFNHLPPKGAEEFQLGVDIAATPGRVIYRNHLIELIQYEATTAEVYADPILIVPAWIMKYYILDLSAHNSLVKYLVGQGHTVFMISWKNPASADRHLDLDDYLNQGIFAALEAIVKVVPTKKVHAVGYCIGGTLLTMAAAAMANAGDERIKSMTLFAAQVDFKDAGDLLLFVDQSQVTYLKDMMWESGYLDGAQMGGAFSLLGARDRYWAHIIQDYFMGDRRPVNDLMAWNADTTRLPYKMHTQYLQSLFLDNDLVEGRFKVNHHEIALIDIKIPIFTVGTVTDQVAPWRSVYKIHLFTATEVTFLLTSGGHNAGIVSEPNHPGRTYQVMTRKPGDKYISAEKWRETAPKQTGSWWPAWQAWLAAQSGKKVKPPSLGNAQQGFIGLCAAPGTYVLQK